MADGKDTNDEHFVMLGEVVFWKVNVGYRNMNCHRNKLIFGFTGNILLAMIMLVAWCGSLTFQ